MQVNLDSDICERVQSLTSVKLNQPDYKMFADWLVSVGVQTVKAALKQNKHIQLGDLVMMQFQESLLISDERIFVELNYLFA